MSRPTRFLTPRSRLAAALLCLMVSAPSAGADLNSGSASRFAELALACVHREYPNKIAHVMQSDEDLVPPRKLTPAFYGCYDWHSAVHAHWLLTRIARRFPNSRVAAPALGALGRNLTESNIAGEMLYLTGPGRVSFERPYGLAWLLALAMELREWDDPGARTWRAALAPLEREAADRIRKWLPVLHYPIRAGEHSQTAFALGLIYDWAREAGDKSLLKLIRTRSTHYYGSDRDCPLHYEPSGQDFLSPCLAEADLMRRLMSSEDFARYLGALLPRISLDGGDSWLPAAIVTDRSDPKLAHLDGLNLSRAWMLEGIASALPPTDPRRGGLRAAADAHREASLPAVTDTHYEGGHWLGSFATYLVTGRGLPAVNTH